MQYPGRFIIIDGITGSGKSTLLEGVQKWSEANHQSIFRLNEWSDDAPPCFEDVSGYDVYFTYEPTRTWVGRAIRYELSQNEQPYGGEELAHAFALDRQIMYRRLIIPALKAGKTIIQDRGVSTSLVYQPVMPNSVPLEIVMALPGNKLALAYAPNALVLTKIPAQMAMERIRGRSDESKGVFGQLELLKKLEQRFEELWLKEIFEQRGTVLYDLDTSGSLEETKEKARQLIEQILAS